MSKSAYNSQMNQTQNQTLPILSVLDQIKSTLSSQNELVLEAPPGAGKTTMVPLALLDASWLKGKKIIMLEPRRMAARAAAQRMSDLLDEPVGKQVGYRVRLDSNVSNETRIEVITEGILTRRLQSDPALDGVGLVIFDEFHERNLDTDLSLALCLQARALLREASDPLKLLVMSATLDGQAVANLLSENDNASKKDVTVIRSEGRMFPVDIVYSNKNYPIRESIIEPIVQVIFQALERDKSSILVFLPGQGEISKVQRELAVRLPQIANDVLVLPLYGSLTLAAQQQAIMPLAANKQFVRKIVLSTDIAETSLTIDGVSAVIDSGLAREPVFDPVTGMTRLRTCRISKASSIQRMGRAGRLAPGRCYRLWHEEQQHQLSAQSNPEICQADLAPLALQLIHWGVNDVSELQWLDQPPKAPYSQAKDLLAQLGAIELLKDDRSIEKQWVLTTHGKLMANMPTHPRLAHLLLCAIPYKLVSEAAMLAAMLSDRDQLAHYGADISWRVAVLKGEVTCPQNSRGWLKRTQQQMRIFEKLCAQVKPQLQEFEIQPQQALAYLLACAYPDRIACRRKENSSNYQLSNGRSVMLNEQDGLRQSQWLAVAEVGGSVNLGVGAKADKIFLAAPLDPSLFDGPLSVMVSSDDTLQWQEQTQRFIAEKRRTVGKLVLSREKLKKVPLEEKSQALIKLIGKKGLAILPWTDETKQWQARVFLVRSVDASNEQWPDVSDEGLLNTLDQWLKPYLDDVSSLADFKKLDLKVILASLLSWPQTQALDQLAPVKLKVPSGSNVAIDYEQSPPTLSVKLQEMFGCEQTPAIANGKVSLLVHLLSPARRPIQITQDLAGFWRGSYESVKKDMKGRYPRHPWPDNPLEALPTRYVKRRPSK